MAVSTGEIVRRVKENFANRRSDALEENKRRKLETHEAVPEIAEIDNVLSTMVLRVMSATNKGDMEQIDAIRRENQELVEKKAKLLVMAGFPADYTELTYNCEKCKDSGYVGIDMCSCMREEISSAMLENSGIGKLAYGQSFDNFDLSYYGAHRDRMERNFRVIKSFAEGFSRNSSENYLLMGDTGLGKTHLSTALAVTVIKRGHDVLYDTMQNMVDAFSQVQFRGGSQDEVKRYQECSLLIVDDLGSEMTNQFTVSVLYNLINQRANAGKSTVFSTNLTTGELRDRYSDRITSRLLGMYNPLVFKGTDVRMQKLTGR